MHEAARDQQRAQAERLHRLQHPFGARRQAQALVVDTVEHAGVETLEQRDAAPQALVEVGDLAAHGRLGDGRDLGLEAAEVGDLIDALDGDQGRVHVHRHQAEVGQGAAVRHDGPVDGARAAVRIERFAQRGRERRAVCGAGHGVAAQRQARSLGEGADGVEIGGGERGEALEDQGHGGRRSGAARVARGAAAKAIL